MKVSYYKRYLFLKIPSYARNINVVDEHFQICKKEGNVWIMKMGIKPKLDFIEDIIKQHGGIILMSHSRFGNKFYYGELISIEPSNSEKMYYPDYYNEIAENMGLTINKLMQEEMWFNITNLREIDEKVASNFKLKDKEKNFPEVAKKSYQTSFIYLTLDDNKKVDF